MTTSRVPDSTDLLIVGAGAAGLAAAALVTRHGLRVTILDENGRLGGQYYRQSRLGTDLPQSVVGPSQAAGRVLIGAIDRTLCDIVTEAVVWGADGDRALLYSRHGISGSISARSILVATGAHERVLPFPGWTLTGVMTAGAAQTLIKAQGIVPGRRIAIAGTGPFLYPVATQLAAAGADIAEIAELSRNRFWPLAVGRPYRHLALYREALGYLLTMRRLGLSVRFGETVVSAEGTKRLEAVTLARMDADMMEVPGTRRQVEVDTLLTSFGFVPNLQVARLLGCSLTWDPVQSMHFIAADDNQQSSLSGVFVAGEIAGIGGHRVARAEGTLAAAGVLRHLGVPLIRDAEAEVRDARRRQSAGRQFADHMLRTFALQPGILDLAKADTLVCRCESVPRSEIEYHAKVWNGSPRAVKQCTRAGMGRCQARICGYAVDRLVDAHRPEPGRAVAPDTPRMPVKPLPLRRENS